MAAAAAMLMKTTMAMTNLWIWHLVGGILLEKSRTGGKRVGHSDGEGRNKGGLNERRGGLEERLVVSNGAGTELYHTARVHTCRRKGGWHERIDTPAGQGALGQRPMTWPWLLDVMMMTMIEVVTEIHDRC